MSDPGYKAHAARLSAQADEAYRAWWRALPEAQRIKLVKQGFALDSHLPNDESDNPKRDALAESARQARLESAVKVSTDHAAAIDGAVGTFQDIFGVSATLAARLWVWMAAQIDKERTAYQAFLMNRMVGAFLMRSNPRLSAGALAFAANLDALNGLGTLTEFAARYHVSKAAVSKEMQFWRDSLDLPDSPHMKTRKARGNCSLAQKKHHWRNKKCQNLITAPAPSTSR